MPVGAAFAVRVGNSLVTAPVAGFTRPILLALSCVNQIAASGPLTTPLG